MFGVVRKKIKQHEMLFDADKYKHKLLDVFRNYDAFCRKYDLTYSIAYGTMLGAVRHRGFIPWDDDIDVIMPRDDYNRFIKLTMNGMCDGYSVISPHNSETYYMPFAKVYDHNTTIIELDFFTDCPIGIFIDVFPIDGIPDNTKKFKWVEWKFYHHLERARIMATKGKIRRKRLLHYFFYMLLFNKRKEFLKSEQIAASIPISEGQYVQYYGGESRERGIMHKSIFKEIIDLPFENMVCKCTAKTDYYLTKLYGDYMQLPLECNRVSHHYHYFIDMENGWSIEDLKQKGIIR